MADDAPVDIPRDEQTQEQSSGGTTATATPGTRPRKPAPKPAPPKLDRMPPWKLLLHNDSVNDMMYVVDAICELTTLNRQMAVQRMLEAHTRGVSLLLSTHREHAELLAEQFTSKKLTVTIEKDG